MPVTPTEIMVAKVYGRWGWLASAALSLTRSSCAAASADRRVRRPVPGAATLFATTSMGIFMATLARSMPQFGMLLVLVLLPLQMLSGGTTPRDAPVRAGHHAGRARISWARPGHSLPGRESTSSEALPRPGPDRHRAVHVFAGPLSQYPQPDGRKYSLPLPLHFKRTDDEEDYSLHAPGSVRRQRCCQRLALLASKASSAGWRWDSACTAAPPPSTCPPWPRSASGNWQEIAPALGEVTANGGGQLEARPLRMRARGTGRAGGRLGGPTAGCMTPPAPPPGWPPRR